MTATYRFDGKRALVTGAGRGIGWGIAKRLSECGAEVFALSKTQANLDSLVKEVPKIHPICVDMEDWDATRKAVEEIGPIHLLVNNASILLDAPFLGITKDQLDSSFAVNVNGTINVSQIVVRGMIERGEGGSIVIMSSIVSHLGFPCSATYSSTKGALDSLMRVMATELGEHKIRVNTIHPTVTWTDMGRHFLAVSPENTGFMARHPLGQYADVDHIVDGTLFLLSDQAAMVTGSRLPVDGGLLSN